jgi:hypothetical protein
MRETLRIAALVAFLVLAVSPGLQADDMEFRYVRPFGSRVSNWQPRESFAVSGGQIYFFSPNPQPQPPPPTHWLPFRHPYTHAYVIVPAALPDGMPRIEQRTDRIIYDYGTGSVVFHFVRDGFVNVSYHPKTP